MVKQIGKAKRVRQLAYRVEQSLVDQLDALTMDTIQQNRYMTTRSEIINMILKEGLDKRGYSVETPTEGSKPKGR